MNILYYSEAPPLNGGAENVLYYLNKELSKKYLSVIQYNFTRKEDLTRIPIGKSLLDPVFSPNISKLGILYRSFSSYKRLNHNIKKYNIDILNSFFLRQGALGSYVAKKNNIPHVITEHGMLLFQLEKKIDMKMIKYAIKNTAKIVCVDKNIYNTLIRMGVGEEKLEYITNGVDTTEFIPNYEKRHPRRVLFMSRLVEWKGPEFLINTIPHVVKEIPDAEFWFVGDGPLKNYLEVKSHNLGITKNVKFWGWVPRDVQRKLINMCSVYTSLQFYENFTSLALFEAMACGLSVIVTDVGESRNVVNKNGFLINKCDEENLSNKLITLLNDNKKCREMGKMSRRIVEKEHTWEIVAKKYENVYKNLVR